MSDYRFTPAARHDLGAIWEFTEERWGAAQAETYIVDIREAVERVAAHPELGRPVDELRHGYRRYVVGSHLIFCVQRDHGIDVIRILHQRMDPARHL